MPRVKQETRKCSAAGCENKHLARGLCRTHYQRARDNYEIEINRPEKINGGEWLVGGCGLIAITRGFCSKHYAKFQRYGDPLFESDWYKKRGEKIINDQGYVEVYVGADHPMARDSRVGEHRLVMSEHLGRPLFENENVHHKNGDKTDNRIENLELWVVAQPKGQRPPDLLKYARG